LKGRTVASNQVNEIVIQLAIPKTTSASQLREIMRAVEYGSGLAKPVQVIVTKVK
jgi:hypothetical protein